MSEGPPAAADRLRERIKAKREVLDEVRAAKAWTAVATVSGQLDKLEAELSDLEADDDEEVRQMNELSHEAVMGEIVRTAKLLPSYVLDDLIDALEECRVVAEEAS